MIPPPDLDAFRARLFAAADEARNVQPDGETWTDDQAGAVETFAVDLLDLLGWTEEWLTGNDA